jgi:GAF domain-containing protein
MSQTTGSTAETRVATGLQQIVDEVVITLGLNAAMLSIVDEETNCLPVRAAHVDSALLDWGQKLTGKRLVGESVSMDEFKNEGVRAIHEGVEYALTNSLHAIFRPALGKSACQLIQKSAGLKVFAIIPVRANDKVIGNLYAGTERENISEREVALLRRFAEHAAVVLQDAPCAMTG